VLARGRATRRPVRRVGVRRQVRRVARLRLRRVQRLRGGGGGVAVVGGGHGVARDEVGHVEEARVDAVHSPLHLGHLVAHRRRAEVVDHLEEGVGHEPATVGGGGCNRRWGRLQPWQV